ncbi:hypothetical protein W823_09575 [Williamsia sp. D3]|nr:hypothetical protein W823_09575 [Williamsia sp. D3]
MGKPPQRGEEQLSIGPGQRRSGLIEDEQSRWRLPTKCPHDGDCSALGRRQLPDERTRVDVVAEIVDGQGSPGPFVLLRDRTHPAAVGLDEEVLGNTQIVDETQILVDEAQTRIFRSRHRPQFERASRNCGNTAGIRAVVAGEEFHQRRLPATILTDDGMDLAATDVQVYRVESELRSERLGHAS